MATDRAIKKEMEAGALNSRASSTANAIAAVSAAHTRSLVWTKSGNENSSNSVAETVMFTVNRAGVVKTVKLLTNSTVTNGAANGFLVTVSKRTAGAAAVPVARWNTSSDAQGTITALVPASLVVVTSSDANIAAGDIMTFTCAKNGTGLLLDSPASVTVDIEEV
jgi:hypothetical protein